MASAAVTSTLVTGSAATTTRRTGVGEAATAARIRSWKNSALAKNSGASQRNSTRPGISARLGIAGDVVIAGDAVGAAENGGMRPPAVPQELDDGDDDGKANSGTAPSTATPTKHTYRQPELPALDTPDAAEVGHFDQADRRGDDDGGKCRRRQMLQEIGSSHQQRGNAQGADDTGELGLRAGRFRHRGARRAAADRKALEKSGGEIGGAQPNHLLVGIDVAGRAARRMRGKARWCRRTTPRQPRTPPIKHRPEVGDSLSRERRTTGRPSGSEPSTATPACPDRSSRPVDDRGADHRDQTRPASACFP